MSFNEEANEEDKKTNTINILVRSINDYRKNLNDCINKPEKAQDIDNSKIICEKFKTNKSETYNNQFYVCLDCNINICPLCKSMHNKDHNIKNYDESPKNDEISKIDNSKIICEYCKTNKSEIFNKRFMHV